MQLRTVSGGGRFEQAGAYVRAKRVGPFICVAGTTAMEPSGRLHAPGDTYAQTIFTFDRIAEVLHGVGAELRHVTRTRAFLTDIRTGGEYVRAHGEVFAEIRPVTTAVQAGLATPGLMVEIEVDAIVHDEHGEVSY